MIREATANEPRTECSGQPPGVSNCPVEVIGEAVGSGTSKRSSGGSMGGQGWKRQYREAEESDTEIEVNTTKKQRTRTLELSRKGGKKNHMYNTAALPHGGKIQQCCFFWAQCWFTNNKLNTMYFIVSPVQSTYGGYYGLVIVTPRPQTLHRLRDNFKNPYRIAFIFYM